MSGLVPRLLSLYDLSGVWSAPYREAGWEVVQVDLQAGLDARFLAHDPAGFAGILAAFPCTTFTNASSRLWPAYDADGRTAAALALVDAACRAVALYRPRFWCFENPVGRLRRWLGAPRCIVHPYQFGDGYTKATCLWGEFTPPQPGDYTRPMNKNGQSWISNLPPSADRANIRAQTPPGFARAFHEANP